MRYLAPFAIFTTVAVARYDLGPCEWRGTAPICQGACESVKPYQLTFGQGGGGNGAYCNVGIKVLCCPNADTWKNCEWFGTAPACSPGSCPKGKVQVTTDSSGDGSYCVTGNKLFCCDKGDDLESNNENMKWNTGMRIAAKLAQNALVD
ncbi:hypothetical protein FRC12_019127 [Ceratobasidium sp. 428]|nr:hypothetical protein FRC12_019127 [Ceratobasidium sp. 428]